MHACCRPPGEKGGQGGMGDNQGVVLLTHQVPQLGLCPKISGGGHALFKGKGDHPVRVGQVWQCAPASHIDFPSQSAESAQIGQVKGADMGKGRGGE